MSKNTSLGAVAAGRLLVFLVCFLGVALAATSAHAVFPASTKGGGLVLGWPDVAKTPGVVGAIPIPFPNIGQSGSTGTKTYGTKVGAKKTDSSADTATLTIVFDALFAAAELPELTIFLGQPGTGVPLGPEFQFSVDQSSSGEIVFDVTNLVDLEFELVFQMSLLDLGDDIASGLGISVETEGLTLTSLNIPEPAAAVLLAVGLAGLGWARRRRRS